MAHGPISDICGIDSSRVSGVEVGLIVVGSGAVVGIESILSQDTVVSTLPTSPLTATPHPKSSVKQQPVSLGPRDLIFLLPLSQLNHSPYSIHNKNESFFFRFFKNWELGSHWDPQIYSN